MKIFLGSDHGGYELKQKVSTFLQEKGHETEDLGCGSPDSCDYPVFGARVGREVVENEGSRGIVICGSGNGIAMAANKIKGVRCALANSIELARLGREHNGANVLSLGERTQFIDDPLEIVETFLSTEEDRSERHERRRGELGNL